MFVKTLVILQFLLLSFCLGCAGTKSFLAGDLLAPESRGPLPAASGPCAYNGYDDDYGEDGGYGGGSQTGPQTMLMAYVGRRKVDENDWAKEVREWGEIGITGVHVINEEGLAIDWRLLNPRMTLSETIYNPGTGGITRHDAEVDAIELLCGVRYIIFATDWFWPFIRCGIGYQNVSFEEEFLDVGSGSTISFEGSGHAWGGGIGAGMDFAFGNFRMEIGVEYTWLGSDVDMELNIAGLTFESEFENIRVGGEPGVYVAIGAGF